jgi:4-amino-4-deoxy-L-arabinose transferase-like glycosyltransferase
MERLERPREETEAHQGLMRREHLLLLAIVAAFTLSVGHAILQRAPFEVDESVYAVQARAWAAGGPVTGIRLQRAPLIPAIGALEYMAGARAELPFRATGLVFGIAAIVMVFVLGRVVFGPNVGLLAAAVFASAPTVQQRASQFLTDVPATAVLLGLALLLWRNRDRSTWSLLLLAPLAAAAFYIRYASILPIGALLLVALFLWHRSLLKNKALVAATILLFAALLIPHVVRAVDATGRPWGILSFTAHFSGRKYIGQGLPQYLAWLPFTLAGPLAGITIVAGIVTAAAKRTNEMTFLAAPAVLHIVLLGLTNHGEPRFVFFPIALLCIAGSNIALGLIRDRRVPVVAAAAGLIGAGIFVSAHNSAKVSERLPAKLAGTAIAARIHPPCTVLAVELGETTWYSGCSTYYFADPSAPKPDYLVLYRTGGVRLRAQPPEPPGSHGPPIPILHNGREVATVFRVRAPVQ